MAVLDEALTYILANTTGFKDPTSTGGNIPIYRSELPAERPDIAVSLHEPGGVPPLAGLSSTVPLAERPGLQVISRAPTYIVARSNIQTIWDAFFTLRNVEVSKEGSTATTTWIYADPVGSPNDMGDDSKNRSMLSANFQISKEMS